MSTTNIKKFLLTPSMKEVQISGMCAELLSTSSVVRSPGFVASDNSINFCVSSNTFCKRAFSFSISFFGIFWAISIGAAFWASFLKVGWLYSNGSVQKESERSEYSCSVLQSTPRWVGGLCSNGSGACGTSANYHYAIVAAVFKFIALKYDNEARQRCGPDVIWVFFVFFFQIE